MIKSKAKFFTVMFIFAVLVFALVGCSSSQKAGSDQGNKDQAAVNSSKDEKQAEKPAEKPLVTFSNKSLGYYFFVVQSESLKKTVEDRGWKFEDAVADFDSARQMNQFMNFIAKKPKAIVSDPIDSEGLVTAIDKANQAGIPVAILDTPTTGGDVAVTVAFDNYAAGQMAAKEIIKRLEKKYGEPKGVVLNAYGAMSSWAWRLRKEGMDDEFKKYPNITYLAMPGEGDITKTHDALVNALAKYDFIDAVHAPSDTPARGLYEALKEKGMLKKRGEEGHVIIVTIDAEPVALQGIKEGTYDATINQDAVSYGEIALELMEKYTFKGEKVPTGGDYQNNKYYWEKAPIKDSPSGPYVEVPPYVIDETNVDDPRHWANISYNEWGLTYK